jgi:hypothetical protein
MKSLVRFALLTLACSTPLLAQGAAIDWPFAGSDAQHTGWEKSDSRITKDNVKDFQMVMKMNLDPKLKGSHSFTPPVVIGRLISYRGFKELAFVESASDRLWAIDADMNRIFWEKHFEKPLHTPKNTGPNAAMCSGAVAAMPSLMPAPAFGGRPPAGAPGAAARPNPAAIAPPTPAGAPVSAAKSLLSAGGFGGPRPAFAVSGDGKLHLMNTSTGEDVTTAMKFLPPGAKASNLTVSGGVVYTTTIAGCGGVGAGVWALDLNGEEPKAASFTAKTGEVRGIVIGTEGTVFAQGSDTVLALGPKDLKVTDSFTVAAGLAASTPVLFTYQNRELMVTAGKDGRLYVLDPKALGGTDHKTPLSETAAVGNVWGGLSSWQDTDGTRWVLAPVWGPVDPAVKSGAIVAYRLVDSNGVPTLTQAWVSRDLSAPEPPVITSGIVFALSAGDYANERAKPSGHATLYAFDGATGKELYTSGDHATAPANLTGMTLANGRVFFTTTDGTLYGFGIFLER